MQLTQEQAADLSFGPGVTSVSLCRTLTPTTEGPDQMQAH